MNLLILFFIFYHVIFIENHYSICERQYGIEPYNKILHNCYYFSIGKICVCNNGYTPTHGSFLLVIESIIVYVLLSIWVSVHRLQELLEEHLLTQPDTVVIDYRQNLTWSLELKRARKKDNIKKCVALIP